MSRYMCITSFVQIVGKFWVPRCDAATHRELSSYDVENIRAYGDGAFTRSAVAQWLAVNSGDFSSVTDFYAEIEDGAETHTFEWADEDSELTYNDCMFPNEDE